MVPATPATRVLEKARVPFHSHSYDHDPRAVAEGLPYGQEAAEALGVPAEQVFKTLLVDCDGRLCVVVVPVLARVALKAVAAEVHGRRAHLCDPALAERTTGYRVGGISPLGQKRRLPTVIDASALDQPSIFVSGGRRGFDIELAPADLVRLTDATVARITA